MVSDLLAKIKKFFTIILTSIISFFEIIWYEIEHFFERIYRIITWIPVLWNVNVYDSTFLFDVMIKQLSDMNEFFSSDKKTHIMDAPRVAEQLQTMKNLLQKTYIDEEYALEYIDILEEKYGSDCLFIFDEDKKKFEKQLKENHGITLEDYNKELEHLFKKSQNKQKKAEKLTWKYMYFYVKTWWD